MVHIILSFTLLFFSSCALLKEKPPLKEASIDHLLNSIKVTGEGRGRLGLDQRQYLFGLEALLKDNKDWVLAVSVPLHGEEVMVLPDIKEAAPQSSVMESFEARVQNEIDQKFKNSDLTGKDYIRELRSLIRFVLAPKLLEKRTCKESSPGLHRCQIGKDYFKVNVNGGKIVISKKVSKKYLLNLQAENLTDSHFSRTNFHLLSSKGPKERPALMSLELFWR